MNMNENIADEFVEDVVVRYTLDGTPDHVKVPFHLYERVLEILKAYEKNGSKREYES